MVDPPTIDHVSCFYPTIVTPTTLGVQRGGSIPLLCCHGKAFLLWSMKRDGGWRMEVVIHLPEDVAAAVPWEDVPRHILEQIALEGYQERWLSEAQIRRLLGYGTRMQVHGFLKAHGVPLDYTVEDLEQDREAYRHLGL